MVALALWGSGFITASIATMLIIVARGTIPDFWSIIVGNALLAAAYGVLWCGAEQVCDRSVVIGSATGRREREIWNVPGRVPRGS
jgi:hypothetical protein